MRLRRTALVAGVAGTGLLLGTSSAWAYFSTTGSGGGTASAGHLQVQVQVAEPGTGLIPGGSADAVLRLHNPQPIAITLVAVQATGAAVPSNGCTPTGISFTDQLGLSVSIPAGATSVVRLPGAVAMSLASAAACQGARFDIPVSVTVRS